MKKRRKLKDNPYILGYNEYEYWVEFFDSKNTLNRVTISKELFDIFDRFELDDLKELNEYDRHTEHFDLNEEQIFQRCMLSYDVERDVEDIILSKNITTAINSLSKVQKQRIIKYYFEGKTLDEIAQEEGTSHQAVSKSILNAIGKMKKKLKI